MKFLCMAYEEQKKLDDLTESEWQVLRQETLDYVESLRKSGHLVTTHALKSATTGSIVRVRDGRLAITDGPFAETKEQIGGFFLVEARDREEAIGIAAKWPSARIGSIEVRPVEEGLSPDRRYEADTPAAS